MQPNVQLVGCDHTDRTITVLVENTRMEFFLRPDLYHRAWLDTKNYIDSKWFNQTLANLLLKSHAVCIPSTFQAQMETTMSKPPGSNSRPNDEFPWTLIAPEAMKGLFYQGERVWWKTEDAAKEYAAEIFEKNKDRQAFELAVVNYTLILKPKPQIEMSETRRQEAARVS